MITIYSTNNCKYCDLAKAFLKERGEEFTVVDVGTDLEARKYAREISGQLGVPVITIDDEVCVGFDPEGLAMMLD